jgi:hypothetical protein
MEAFSLVVLNGNTPLRGTSKNVGEAASARQKQAKKRSLRAVNEHFEPVFNAAMATQVVFRGALWADCGMVRDRGLIGQFRRSRRSDAS